VDPATLIPECAGRGSKARFIARAADLRCRTLVIYGRFSEIRSTMTAQIQTISTE
jgi:hypothetical protein